MSLRLEATDGRHVKKRAQSNESNKRYKYLKPKS